MLRMEDFELIRRMVLGDGFSQRDVALRFARAFTCHTAALPIRHRWKAFSIRCFLIQMNETAASESSRFFCYADSFEGEEIIRTRESTSRFCYNETDRLLHD